MRRRLTTLLVAALVLLTAAALVARPYAEAAAFLMDLAGARHWSRTLLPGRPSPITTRDLVIPSRDGTSLQARLYMPARHDNRPGFVIIPGIHRGGVDEPRLDGFSRRLASAGTRVLSVPLPDLREFRVTPRATDQIEDAVAWAASDPAIARDGRVSLGGVSFAGGLALVAAGRPAIRDRLSVVVSFGGYGDLRRVLRYLSTGVLPDGRPMPPHDYGLAIVLLEAAPSLVPAPQVEPLRAGILTFLDGSLHNDREPAKAAELYAAARAQAEALPEPARTLLTWVNERQVDRLGPALMPFLQRVADDPSLSPERSPAPRAPVFLLHGEGDTVIPALETLMTADYLRAQGNPRVRTLLTPLVSHADLQTNAPAGDLWELVKFWRAIMRAAD